MLVDLSTLVGDSTIVEGESEVEKRKAIIAMRHKMFGFKKGSKVKSSIESPSIQISINLVHFQDPLEIKKELDYT